LGARHPVAGLGFVTPQTTVGEFSPLLTGSNTQAMPFQKYSVPVALPYNNLVLLKVDQIFIPAPLTDYEN